MDFFLPTWVIFVVVPLACIVIYSKWKHRLFQKYGIPGPKPSFIFGILPSYKQNGLVWTDMQMMSTYGNVVGVYHGHNPVMLISDPNMIKEICINKSDIFINRASAFDACGTLGSAVALADGDHWKFLRSKLCPVFTKDKLEQITSTLEECIGTMIETIKQSCKYGTSFDFRRHCGHLSMDILLSGTLGKKVNSAKCPDDILVTQAIGAWKAGTTGSVSLGSICVLCPAMRKVLKYFNISPCSNDVITFFKNITKDKLQSNPCASPNDFLTFLTEKEDRQNNNSIGDKEQRELTEDEITANLIFFVMAGYDTTANALAFLAHSLATNPTYQEKLLQEINTKIGSEKLCYDNVMALPYLDQIVSETLRLFPPMARFNRRANNDSTVCGQYIPRGMDVSVPVFAVHRDPRFWSEPNKFDPERFSPEQMKNRPAYSYIPFGAGPRHCFASKLALFELKLTIVHLLKHFKFQPAPETERPPKLEKGGFLRPENGIWLSLQEL